MALVRGCSRCGTGWPRVTQERTPTGPVEVRLCDDCLTRASAENTAAQARSVGSDPVTG
jgi:hypothetical protein